MLGKFSKNVVYYYDEDFGTYTYSTLHPMKPLRVTITDDLIRNYGLNKHMDEIVYNHFYHYYYYYYYYYYY